MGGKRIECPKTLVDVILKKDYVFSVQNEMKGSSIENQFWVRTRRLNCYDQEEVKSCMIEFKEDMQIQTCLVNQDILYVAEFNIDDNYEWTVEVFKHDFSTEEKKEVGTITYKAPEKTKNWIVYMQFEIEKEDKEKKHPYLEEPTKLAISLLE
jgi:hypothetical protein